LERDEVRERAAHIDPDVHACGMEDRFKSFVREVPGIPATTEAASRTVSRVPVVL